MVFGLALGQIYIFVYVSKNKESIQVLLRGIQRYGSVGQAVMVNYYSETLHYVCNS